ncbi:hypothetical protein PT974_05568 [Cladobotryum mycophilum]|uniref:Uncharacterized protein n=1 Tax=Cladobotryum mycophilum TaxID=491253 RepID=A0ABR0SJ29_9HYPO
MATPSHFSVDKVKNGGHCQNQEEHVAKWLRWTSVAVLMVASLVALIFLKIVIPHASVRLNLDSLSVMKFYKCIFACVPVATALNITYYKNEPLAPSPLPPSHAASDGETIIELFQNLGRSTIWKSIANISFEGDTFEPEGMVRLGNDRYVISCGEYTEPTQKYDHIMNGTDRSAGKGFAYLMVYNGKGERIADATVTKKDAEEYHNGGLDYDGKFIWGTIAQYRPNTTAYAYKANPRTLEPQTMLHYVDHLGGIVHDTRDNSITCLNWGSRNASTWNLEHTKVDCTGNASPKPNKVVRNPSYFADYQDCKWLGHSKFYHGNSVALCSGVATLGTYTLGGIALVDVATMIPLAEVPIMLESALGVRLTMNPMDVSVEDGKLRFYWLPDQHNSTLYIYEAQPKSPFEYGGGTI